MKITEEQLKNILTELYTYYFKKSRDFYNCRPDGETIEQLTPAKAYEIGTHNGATEAIGAVMLQVFGGKEYGEIWEMTLKWCDATESEGGNNNGGES